jgi:hypothetical protein
MTRSVLQPIRSRRVTRTATHPWRDNAGSKVPALTPATRKTLAAIGALWVSFAVTASANASPSSGAAIAGATVAQSHSKMVTVSPPSGELTERGREHARRTGSRVIGRSYLVPGSPELPAISEAQHPVLLTTTKRPVGSAPRSPTTDYRQKKDDAVIAYLMLVSR